MGMFLRRGSARKLTLTITKSNNGTVLDENIAYVMVNGVKYYTNNTVLEVDRGTVVEVCVGASGAIYEYKCYVAIDEKHVLPGAGIYRYTVKKSSTLTFGKGISSNGEYSWRYCIITRE